MKAVRKALRAYAPGPFRNFLVMEEFMLEDMPAKQDGDVASIYISLEGDNFCEAVSVIVRQEDGDLPFVTLSGGGHDETGLTCRCSERRRAVVVAVGTPRAAVAELGSLSRHEVAFNTVWLERS